jgi:hypothetical protein
VRKVYDWLTAAVTPQKYHIPHCLKLRCTQVADGFAMLLKVDGGTVTNSTALGSLCTR